MEIERSGRHNELRQACPGVPRSRTQCFGAGRRQVRSPTQKLAAISRLPTAEAARLGPIEQALEPILPVTREALRGAIGSVFLHQEAQRAERVGTDRQLV